MAQPTKQTRVSKTIVKTVNKYSSALEKLMFALIICTSANTVLACGALMLGVSMAVVVPLLIYFALAPLFIGAVAIIVGAIVYSYADNRERNRLISLATLGKKGSQILKPVGSVTLHLKNGDRNLGVYAKDPRVDDGGEPRKAYLVFFGEDGKTVKNVVKFRGSNGKGIVSPPHGAAESAIDAFQTGIAAATRAASAKFNPTV